MGKALPADARQGDCAAHFIAVAKRNTVAVAETELGKVAVQVLLAAMLTDAFHAALED